MLPEATYYDYADLRALRGLKHDNIELYLISCGLEPCTPGHCFGPGFRDKFLIHFVISGQGTFYAHGKEYKLHAGQAFIFFPDVTVKYVADEEDPWTYTWVGFHGTMAETYLQRAGILIDTDVIDFPEAANIPFIIQKMLNSNSLTYANELLRQSYLLELLATIIAFRKVQEGPDSVYTYPCAVYTEQAVHYITKEYMNDISVVGIAEKIGITRSYLSKCFNATLKMSPKQFIIKYRMDKACELLKKSNKNITEIADAVGYSNSLTFSKAFKTYFGISPNEKRKEMNYYPPRPR